MANLITLVRFPLLIAVVLLLYVGHPTPRLIAVPLVIILILMDTLDGIVARARKEVSVLGSVLDIMADRSVELVMWVVYAHVGLIPVAIPIIYILRGVVVDALRNMHVSEGQAPFDTMTSKVGRWLVGGRVMRSSYGFTKALSFAGLALTNALAIHADGGTVLGTHLGPYALSLLVFRVMSWLAVALCLLRGIPVLIEAAPLLAGAQEAE